MTDVLLTLLRSLSSIVKTRAALQIEIVALRHQINVLRRSVPKHPRLRPSDRLFWTWLSRVWPDWRSALVLVKPETLLAWHRKGSRFFWTWKSRHGRAGRPSIPKDVRELIHSMSKANALWGAPRVHGEILKLGIELSQATVAKYMVRYPKPPSQTWRTFLENHSKELVSIDFFTVPTITFHVLYVFLVLAHDRRRVIHFNVTAHPTAEWVSQQLVQAFPWDTAPRYLVRDRDAIYGERVRRQLKDMAVKEILTAPRSPWQSPYVRTLDRIHPTRMPRPHHCDQPRLASQNTTIILRLLSQEPHSPRTT
jgi:putative transposase